MLWVQFPIRALTGGNRLLFVAHINVSLSLSFVLSLKINERILSWRWKIKSCSNNSFPAYKISTQSLPWPSHFSTIWPQIPLLFIYNFSPLWRTNLLTLFPKWFWLHRLVHIVYIIYSLRIPFFLFFHCSNSTHYSGLTIPAQRSYSLFSRDNNFVVSSFDKYDGLL